jgi:hypothetical protein
VNKTELEVSEVGSMVRLDMRLTAELLGVLTIGAVESADSRNSYVEELLWSVPSVVGIARRNNVVRKARPPRGKPRPC